MIFFTKRRRRIEEARLAAWLKTRPDLTARADALARSISEHHGLTIEEASANLQRASRIGPTLRPTPPARIPPTSG